MVEIKERKSINDDLHKYDYLAKKDSFIEVTEWANGEGWDISIDDKIISLSWGQLDAINFLVNHLRYNNK